MSKYQTLKEEAWLANREIPERGLALYTWGNVSAFDPDSGLFAIKPSGIFYNKLTADDIVVIDLEGRIVEGTLRPSSDTPTHMVLYREFALKKSTKIRGIIHTHSTYAVSWAQACQPVPVFGTTHADHLQTSIPCTPLLSCEAVERNYELETGNLIVNTLRKEKLQADEVSMVLVGGHGPFAWGTSAEEAVYNGAVLEEVAKMALLTLMVDPHTRPLPEYIVTKHYERKHGSNAYYGQKK